VSVRQYKTSGRYTATERAARMDMRMKYVHTCHSFYAGKPKCTDL